MKSSRLDFLFLVLIVSLVTLQPYFKHGAINFYETGQYFPQINEVFHGRVLYRDMFVMRGPLEMLMPAFLMKLFGKHISLLSAYFYFGTVLTLIIYAICSLRLFSTRLFSYLFTLVLTARTFTRVCFAIWGGIRFGFGILAILLAINFLRRKKTIWLILAGMATSLGFLTSVEIGVFSFISIFVMFCFLVYCEKNINEALKHMLIYLMGTFVVCVPFILYLFFHNAFIYYISTLKIVIFRMTDVFNASLVFSTPADFKDFLLAFSPWNHNFKYTLPFFFYFFIGIYLFRKIITKKITVPDISILLIFIYGVFLYKGAFRDIEGPQYRMALQPLLLIMFFYLERIYIHIKKIRPRFSLKKILVWFFIFLVPFYSVGFSLYKYNKRFFIFKELKSLIVYRRHIDIPYTDPEPLAIKSERAKGVIVPGHQVRDIDAVVSYITSNTEKREIVFTYPDLGTYNFLFDRPPLGRFYTAEFSFMHPQWFEELISDLESKKPRFIVTTNDFSRLEQFRPTVGTYLDQIHEYLAKNYKTVESYTRVKILELREDI